MSIPANLRYQDSHEWISASEKPASVGITNHAQAELSDVVYVELPEVGRDVAKGDPVAVVESVKAASDIYAPVGGKIVEVNEALNDSPALINESPQDNGWIFRIEVADSSEVEALMDADAYGEHIG